MGTTSAFTALAAAMFRVPSTVTAQHAARTRSAPDTFVYAAACTITSGRSRSTTARTWAGVVTPNSLEVRDAACEGAQVPTLLLQWRGRTVTSRSRSANHDGRGEHDLKGAHLVEGRRDVRVRRGDGLPAGIPPLSRVILKRNQREMS